MNTPLTTQILQLGLDDWIDLPQVAWSMRTHTNVHEPNEVREKTLELIEDLMKQGYVSVGELLGSGATIQFRDWGLDIPSTLKELEKRWLDYGGPIHPQLGNIVCWIMNTPKGDEVARASMKHTHPQ